MNFLHLFDSIALIASIFTLIAFIFRRKAVNTRDLRILLFTLFGVMFFYSVFYWVQWAGITNALETYEDFVGAIIPVFWAFTIYAFYQHSMQKEIQEGEEKLRITLRSIGDGVITTDLEGKVTGLNPTAEGLTGWSMKEAIGRPLGEVFDIVNAKTLEPIDNPVKKVLETGNIIGLANHTQLNSKAGNKYQIADSAAPIRDDFGTLNGVVLVFSDVTKEYRMREQIKGNQARMSAILNSSQDAIFLKDENLRYTHVNEAALRLIGKKRNEVIGKNDQEVIDDMDVSYLVKSDQKVFEGHPVRDTISLKVEGDEVILETSKFPVFNREGKVVGLSGIYRDITEDLKLREQMRQAQKMEAVGRLAGGVAHDLNNLLVPILGYGELLMEDLEIKKEWKESLNEMHQAGLKAKELVGQLLAFSRKQTLEVKPLDINEVLNDFEKLLRRTIPESITFRINTEPGLPAVTADAGQLGQVLMNLVVNASDAMPNGGMIYIETARFEVEDEFKAEQLNLEKGDYIMLSVSDTGTGMDKETMDHIFEPFFSTKGEKGTGLGLATVFGIAKQHKGTVTVYSEMGRGTTFKLYLPCDESVAYVSMAEEIDGRDLKGTESVLLVEDNYHVRKLALKILNNFGYKVSIASDGRKALEMLQKNEQKYDLLLTDVIMPEMNGKELYVNAKELIPDLKVLYMSGYTNDIIVHHGVLEKGVHFIPKPFSMNQLGKKLREVIEECPIIHKKEL